MSTFLSNLEQVRGFLPAFAAVLSINLVVAVARRPLGKVRIPLSILVVLAPALVPPAIASVHPWGMLTTVVTTLAIISAARLPDLDHVLRSSRRGRLEIFLWMCLPMVRFFPKSRRRKSLNRKRAPRYFMMAAIKRLCWEPIALCMLYVPGSSVPWILKSASLMLYFVLNMTAMSDLLSGFCLALGADVDEIFDAPLRSRSPREFWSRRWNKFINRFALKHVAMPIGRFWSASGVIFAVFLTSGAFHEYFAWGVGRSDAVYGSMMLFFILQGIVVLVATRLKVPVPRAPWGTIMTFTWMLVTAPLFFLAVRPALQAFGYPPTWLPF